MEDDPRTYDIIGAAMFVHRELGPGFLEAIYQQALGIVLTARGIPFRMEVPLEVWFLGHRLGCFRADLEAFDDILVELKALPTFGRAEVSQLAHYLTATGKPVGLLINFGSDSLQVQRVLPRRSAICGPGQRRDGSRLLETAMDREAQRQSSAQSGESVQSQAADGLSRILSND